MPGTELQHSFVRVKFSGGISYGGNQTLSDSAVLRKSGCGVISCADTLIYLAKYHEGCKKGIFDALPEADSGVVPLEYYNGRIKELSKRFMPVVPGFGINGPSLAFGLNRYFRKYALPFHARWELNGGRLWEHAADMLRSDIPVILSVGPNFPLVWQKYKLPLYTKTQCGDYCPSGAVKAHFITAASIDDIWICVSSWGKKYYIRRVEYDEYLKKHSAPLVNSALYIKSV